MMNKDKKKQHEILSSKEVSQIIEASKSSYYSFLPLFYLKKAQTVANMLVWKLQLFLNQALRIMNVLIYLPSEHGSP